MKNIMRVGTVYLLIVLIPLSLILAGEKEHFITEEVSLDYISPSELVESLFLVKDSCLGYGLLVEDSKVHVRLNRSNNKILLNGEPQSISEAKSLIKFFDVPPRQIVIEVKIVEINNKKSDEIGLNWQGLLDRTYASFSYDNDYRTKNTEEAREYEEGGTSYNYSEDEKVFNDGRDFDARVDILISDFLKIIKETNVGKVTNTPHIVTTNNKTGRILDGNKITYVSRYSSYSNIYETQEMTAGLSLAVTPSIGQSGYLKLQVVAKLTALGEIISGSPSESGQILNNTVIVKDQESFVLGGFKKTEERKIKKKVPVLGSILPFLFSSEINVESTRDVLLILTPKIIDLQAREIPKM